MSCPNIKVRLIRMHDTKFWCCDSFKLDYDVYNSDGVSWEEPLTIEEYCRIEGIKYCKTCGSKIR
ncbi:MAG: hypothetical protein EHM34_07115 [Nitrosopumilales archaeon]|nr:MAG: hypothetical protein EHM34_07115 [Nitrosopumilales archaeon]